MLTTLASRVSLKFWLPSGLVLVSSWQTKAPFGNARPRLPA